MSRVGEGAMGVLSCYKVSFDEAPVLGGVIEGKGSSRRVLLEGLTSEILIHVEGDVIALESGGCFAEVLSKPAL